MTRTIGIALGILVGLALGFIIAYVWGAGETRNLPIGLLLVIAGAILGFVIEWGIDESVRTNRDLQRQLEERHNNPPLMVEGTVIAPPLRESEVLAEVLRQLHDLKTSPPPAAPISLPQPQENEMVVEVLRQHNEELHKLSQKITVKDTEVENLRQSLDTYRKSHPDELTHIKGIGTVFQRKLRDSGFNSFDQLATADPAQIRRMLGIKAWQKVDIESWIQQAMDWAEHS